MSAAVSEAVRDALAAARRIIITGMIYEDKDLIADAEWVLAALQEGSGALPASPSGGQWQPIETAPHTDHMRQVLLFWPERDVCCGWFDTDEGYVGRPRWWKSPQCGWRSDGDQCIPINQPTHWMPLPDVPSMGMKARQSRNETQPSRSDILERIRAFDFRAHYGEAEYERLADDLEALAQPNQPRDREEG